MTLFVTGQPWQVGSHEFEHTTSSNSNPNYSGGLYFNDQTTPVTALNNYHPNWEVDQATATLTLRDADTPSIKRAAFHTNGEKLWNHDGNVVTGGGASLGGSPSSSQTLIVPNPADERHFYIFTIQDESSIAGHLYYTEFDAYDNNGDGQIVTAKTYVDNYFAEGMTVLTYCTSVGREYILIVKKRNGALKTFVIDNNGFDPSQTPGFHPNTAEDGNETVMQNSQVLDYTGPNRNAGVIISNFSANVVQIFEYDHNTEQLSLIGTYDDNGNGPGSLNNPYGVEIVRDKHDNGEYIGWYAERENFYGRICRVLTSTNSITYTNTNNGFGPPYGQMLEVNNSIFLTREGSTDYVRINNADGFYSITTENQSPTDVLSLGIDHLVKTKIDTDCGGLLGLLCIDDYCNHITGYSRTYTADSNCQAKVELPIVCDTVFCVQDGGWLVFTAPVAQPSMVDTSSSCSGLGDSYTDTLGVGDYQYCISWISYDSTWNQTGDGQCCVDIKVEINKPIDFDCPTAPIDSCEACFVDDLSIDLSGCAAVDLSSNYNGADDNGDTLCFSAPDDYLTVEYYIYHENGIISKCQVPIMPDTTRPSLTCTDTTYIYGGGVNDCDNCANIAPTIADNCQSTDFEATIEPTGEGYFARWVEDDWANENFGRACPPEPGTYDFKWTISDSSGNVDSCKVTLIYVDTFENESYRIDDTIANGTDCNKCYQVIEDYTCCTDSIVQISGPTINSSGEVCSLAVDRCYEVVYEVFYCDSGIDVSDTITHEICILDPDNACELKGKAVSQMANERFETQNVRFEEVDTPDPAEIQRTRGTLYNVLGQQVYAGKGVPSHLPAGTYIRVLETGETYKVVIPLHTR